jgi:hypothetical protein
MEVPGSSLEDKLTSATPGRQEAWLRKGKRARRLF